MLRISQIKIKTDHTQQELRKKAADMLRIPVEEIRSFQIVRQSIDARRKPEIFYSYTVDVEVAGEEKLLRRTKGRLQISKADSVKYRFPKSGTEPTEHSPVIVGMGPAGLFCGYYLALHGYRPVILERGKCVEERQKDVEAFWETGRLDPDSNVQFGEGGAGAFSDGKLNTLVKDKDGRNREVLETFVKFGAKESICYEAKPHIGTDVLCRIVQNMRLEILAWGGQIRFESQATEIHIHDGRITGVVINEEELLPCEHLVLAIGHSARDTFRMLYEKQVPMKAKAFAAGLRVEHPQSMINKSQYGRTGTSEPEAVHCRETAENAKTAFGRLGAAPYKVTAKASNGRGVYSFCMCPGGYVVNASSEPGGTAVNGMSYSGRNGRNANSAIIVSVTQEDFGSDHPLAGVEFQRLLERRAYELGGGKIPVQRYGDFKKAVEAGREEKSDALVVGTEAGEVETSGMSAGEAEIVRTEAGEVGTAGVENIGAGRVENAEIESADMGTAGESFEGKTDTMPESGLLPQCKGEFCWADVSRILPKECNEAFVEGMEIFGRQIRGFDRKDAILSGVESRTSSPVRIERDETLQSQVKGLYPCGEGAGYAGGITSAAMDGLRVAEAIATKLSPVCQVIKNAEIGF